MSFLVNFLHKCKLSDPDLGHSRDENVTIQRRTGRHITGAPRHKMAPLYELWDRPQILLICWVYTASRRELFILTQNRMFTRSSQTGLRRDNTLKPLNDHWWVRRTTKHRHRFLSGNELTYILQSKPSNWSIFTFHVSTPGEQSFDYLGCIIRPIISEAFGHK